MTILVHVAMGIACHLMLPLITILITICITSVLHCMGGLKGTTAEFYILQTQGILTSTYYGS